MLKIIKMISLYLLAVTVAESSSGLPQHLLQSASTFHPVTVTAYTTHPSCTGSGKNVTSSASRIEPEDYGKLVALSSDIASSYSFGDQFDLWVNGRVYPVTYKDSMPKKHRKKVDLLLPSLKSCRDFGRKQGVLIPADRT